MLCTGIDQNRGCLLCVVTYDPRSILAFQIQNTKFIINKWIRQIWSQINFWSRLCLLINTSTTWTFKTCWQNANRPYSIKPFCTLILSSPNCWPYMKSDTNSDHYQSLPFKMIIKVNYVHYKRQRREKDCTHVIYFLSKTASLSWSWICF